MTFPVSRTTCEDRPLQRLRTILFLISIALASTTDGTGPARIAGPSFVYVGDSFLLENIPPDDYGRTTVHRWYVPPETRRYHSPHQRIFFGNTNERYWLTTILSEPLDTGFYEAVYVYTTKHGLPVTTTTKHFLTVLPKPTSSKASVGDVFLVGAPKVAVLGHTLAVACSFRDARPIVYDWSCSNIHKSNPRMTVDADNGWLRVRDVTTSDAGSCTCKTSFGQASFNFTVANKFPKPTHVKFDSETFNISVGVPAVGLEPPSRCTVKFKLNDRRVQRDVNCSAKGDHGIQDTVYIQLIDLFKPNDSIQLGSGKAEDGFALGNGVEIKVALTATKSGKYTSLQTRLPNQPATPSPYSLHLIGNHRAGTLIVHLPAAAAPREGIKRLPITSYSAYYCAEDRSRKRCSKSQPEVWIHGKDLVANSTEIPSDGVKFTIGKVPLGHHYRVLIKIHTLDGLDFSIRTRQSVLFVDPTASYSPPTLFPTIPPRPTDTFRKNNVLTWFSLTRTYSCRNKMELNRNNTATDLHDYIKTICKCNVTTADQEYLIIGDSVKCTPGTVFGRQQIRYEFHLDVADQCRFLGDFHMKMNERQGVVSLPSVKSAVFEDLCVDTTLLTAGCHRQTYTRIDRKSGEVFSCVDKKRFQEHTPDALPVTSAPVAPKVTTHFENPATVVVATDPVVDDELDRRHSEAPRDTRIAVGVAASAGAVLVVIILIIVVRLTHPRCVQREGDVPPDQNNNSTTSHSSTAAATLVSWQQTARTPSNRIIVTELSTGSGRRSASVEYIPRSITEMPATQLGLPVPHSQVAVGSPLRQLSTLSNSCPSLHPQLSLHSSSHERDDEEEHGPAVERNNNASPVDRCDSHQSYTEDIASV